MFQQLSSQLRSNKGSMEEVRLLKEQNDLIRELRNNFRVGTPSKAVATEPTEQQELV